jgi:hypothetical protein
VNYNIVSESDLADAADRLYVHLQGHRWSDLQADIESKPTRFISELFVEAAPSVLSVVSAVPTGQRSSPMFRLRMGGQVGR